MPHATRKASAISASLAPLLRPDGAGGLGLQVGLRRKIAELIAAGVFVPGMKLPSTRKLARDLGLARITVALAYQHLVAEGLLVTRERSGIFVAAGAQPRPASGRLMALPAAPDVHALRASIVRRDLKPPAFPVAPDWDRYPFAFLTDYFDRSLFPVAEWREALRMAQSLREINRWSALPGDGDDPMLLAEIRTKVLPRRGIAAGEDEILITQGAEQAMMLAAMALVQRGTPVGVEEPGNPDLHNLLTERGARISLLPVDAEGLVLGHQLARLNLVCVSPSHQRATSVTMSMSRRRRLAALSARHDFIILEDDADCEANYDDDAFPAIAGLDRTRTVYAATLGKILGAGLRLGFLVAPAVIIAEMRRIRALTGGHPSLMAQRTAAWFLALGHYDSVMLRLARALRSRMTALRDGLNHYLPQWVAIGALRDGAAYWVRGPATLDADALARAAAARGVLIEPGTRAFSGEPQCNVFRLGVSAIPASAIREGVALLAATVKDEAHETVPMLDTVRRPHLKGRELQTAMRGATILYKTVYGDPCTIELNADGTMTGRAGYASEDRDTGTWWIAGDRWCRRWRQWAYGETSELLVRIEGDRIEWYRPGDGNMVDAAVILRRPQRPA